MYGIVKWNTTTVLVEKVMLLVFFYKTKKENKKIVVLYIWFSLLVIIVSIELFFFFYKELRCTKFGCIPLFFSRKGEKNTPKNGYISHPDFFNFVSGGGSLTEGNTTLFLFLDLTVFFNIIMVRHWQCFFDYHISDQVIVCKIPHTNLWGPCAVYISNPYPLYELDILAEGTQFKNFRDFLWKTCPYFHIFRCLPTGS